VFRHFLLRSAWTAAPISAPDQYGGPEPSMLRSAMSIHASSSDFISPGQTLLNLSVSGITAAISYT